MEIEYGNRRSPPPPIVDCRLDVESYSSKVSASRHFNDSDDFDTLADFRLSLVGLGASSRALSSSQSSKSAEEQRDELHSNRYSSVLETVRRTLIECIPLVSEEMVSRAIINAFADSNLDKRVRACNEIEVMYQDQGQDEINSIWRAYDFSQRRTRNSTERDQNDTQSFLQTILDETFLKIQREEITSVERVVRTMSAVLSVLNLKVNLSQDLLADTIILQGLPEHTTRVDLLHELSRFGQVKSVAIAWQNASFGYCRFSDETSAKEARHNHSLVQINGVTPIMTTLNLPATKEHFCKSSGRPAGCLRLRRSSER
jgi:RNA recognition motif. (a.k.a. RRM, RBD, or RNP domain)